MKTMKLIFGSTTPFDENMLCIRKYKQWNTLWHNSLSCLVLAVALSNSSVWYTERTLFESLCWQPTFSDYFSIERLIIIMNALYTQTLEENGAEAEREREEVVVVWEIDSRGSINQSYSCSSRQTLYNFRNDRAFTSQHEHFSEGRASESSLTIFVLCNHIFLCFCCFSK